VSAHRQFALGVACGLIAVFGVAAGLGLASRLVDALSSDGVDGRASEAQRLIEDNYFRSPDAARLERASIRSMIAELRRTYDDHFSQYLGPTQLKAFEASTSGLFDGVGLNVAEVPRGLRVTSVYRDTPADHARIHVGDLISAVDGHSIRGLPSEVSTARIKGRPGTEVDLRILPGVGRPARDIALERASVRIPAVDGSIHREAQRKVGYIRFYTFSEGSAAELRDEIEALGRQGAVALVLDLRGNGGGLLNEAILASSIFIEDGEIASTESRTDGRRTYEAVGDALEPKPTVVLVDRHTASAAEILAAALKDFNAATIVGTRTFGKGTFQEILDLPAGGALDLTIGDYLTANGTSVAGDGLAPDVIAKDNPQSAEDEGLARGLEVLRQR
jgi:carboxyl-terminal processing protease